MRTSLGTTLLAASLIVAGAGPGGAATICIDQLPMEFSREIVIPVGCEIIDCCPGCPAGGFLDWHVRVSGEGFAAAELYVTGGGAPDRSEQLRPGENLLEAMGPARPTGEPPEKTWIRTGPFIAAAGVIGWLTDLAVLH